MEIRDPVKFDLGSRIRSILSGSASVKIDRGRSILTVRRGVYIFTLVGVVYIYYNAFKWALRAHLRFQKPGGQNWPGPRRAILTGQKKKAKKSSKHKFFTLIVTLAHSWHNMHICHRKKFKNNTTIWHPIKLPHIGDSRHISIGRAGGKRDDIRFRNEGAKNKNLIRAKLTVSSLMGVCRRIFNSRLKFKNINH